MGELAAGVYERPAGGAPFAGPPAPGPAEILAARNVVRAHLAPTPLEESAALSRRFGRRVLVKLEPFSPIRSFKARGALAALARLDPETKARGVVTASTGNHGQGVAFAGRAFGIPVAVAAPEGTDAVKLAAMRDLGALLLVGGASLADAERAAQAHAAAEGMLYLEDGEDAGLMAGAATVVWEVLEQDPEVDAVLVPVGGGNLIAASLLAAAALRPDLPVVGVQSTSAPGTTRSWLARAVVREPSRTFAGGLATDRPGERSLAVLDAHLRRVVLVDDADLRAAIRTGYDALNLPVEGAAAAGIAALERFGDAIPGERVALVVTGGRIGAADLAAALA